MVSSAPCPPMVGLVLSSAVVVRLAALLVFPEQSVACQVRVKIPVPAQLPAVEESLKLTLERESDVSPNGVGLNTGIIGHGMAATASSRPRHDSGRTISVTEWPTGQAVTQEQ